LKLAPAREAATIGSVVTNLFDELDEAEAALVRARDGVEQFRASLLHAACTGQLTAAWREASPPAETGADLLRRILDERRTAWERTERARLEARGNMPRGDAWKARYVEPTPPDLTDLPRLPEGWVWASLEQICEIVGGITVDSKRDGSDLIEVPYLRVANVQRGYLKLAQMKTIKAPPVIIEKLLLQPNDLLMNEGGDRDKLGRGWVWNGELPACIHQNHVYRARPYLASIDARFLSHYLNEIGRAFFFDAATQTVNLASVNMSKVSRAPVPFPPEAEIAEIIRMVGDMLAQTERGMTAAEQTQELRQSILHAAFTGRLVPQNSTDEPAAALLARVRATAAPSHRARRTTAAVSA
jgi:type I restriction enzyme S subunit